MFLRLPKRASIGFINFNGRIQKNHQHDLWLFDQFMVVSPVQKIDVGRPQGPAGPGRGTIPPLLPCGGPASPAQLVDPDFLTQCEWKLIFQTRSGRVYVNLLGGTYQLLMALIIGDYAITN